MVCRTVDTSFGGGFYDFLRGFMSVASSIQIATSAARDAVNVVRTKIIATYGPAIANTDVFERLAKLVDVFRLNMAHGDLETHGRTLQRIRDFSKRSGRPIAVLVDLAGPKIRLGKLLGDEILCREGETYTFVRQEDTQEANELGTSYEKLVDELDVGDKVLLADGSVILQVTGKETDRAMCRVLQRGWIRTRQGVNLPRVKLSVPALSEEDIRNAEWAAQQGVDFLGLSFVRSADDVKQLRNIVRGINPDIQIVAKIEKPEALDDLFQIAAVSDALMVARGDLGVEIDVAEVPAAQKRIVRMGNEYQKPVIVATQMLDSMQRSSRPTRAEASDVANAILDGCDACMLSGETAIGEYPIEAAQMLRAIAIATEPAFQHRDQLTSFPSNRVHPVTQAVVVGAEQIAARMGARLICVATRTGATALAISNRRSFVPVIGVTTHEPTSRRMCLYWGVQPVAHPAEPTIAGLALFLDRWGLEQGGLKVGDRTVIVSSGQVSANRHDVVAVHEIG